MKSCDWCGNWPVADTHYVWGYARDLCGYCFPSDHVDERVRRAVSKQHRDGEVSYDMLHRVRGLAGWGDR